MNAWEVGALGLVFIAAIAGSAYLTLHMLIPLGAPATGVPTCQTTRSTQ